MFDKHPIRKSLIIFVADQYLQYGQSEYVRHFGMTIDENPLLTNARVIEPPKLKYNRASLEPSIVRPL
jgi:eukaryotic translation initiation factor 2C